MLNKVNLVLLHKGESVFIAGTDLGARLQEKHAKGFVELFHDTDTDHCIVKFKGRTVHIKNWASFEECGEQLPEPKNISRPQVAGIAAKAQIGGPNDVFTAQVSTPMDKVQNTTKRRAKFQGEETQGE